MGNKNPADPQVLYLLTEQSVLAATWKKLPDVVREGHVGEAIDMSVLSLSLTII